MSYNETNSGLNTQNEFILGILKKFYYDNE